MRNLSSLFTHTSSLLWRASLRHLGRHPWQMALSILGIALGVAVVVAVDLANESARRAFDLSMQTVTGQATHQIVAGPMGLDEKLYVRLRRSGRAPVSAPVVEGHLAYDEQTLQLLGIDPFAESRFRDLLNQVPVESEGWLLQRLLTQPGAVLMSRERMEEFGLSVGQPFELWHSGQKRQAVLAGFFEPPPEQRAVLRDQLLADISTAQELLGRVGRLSRIDLILSDVDVERLDTIKSLLPAGSRLIPAASRGLAMQEMTRAFSVNLTAMSLLALVVGLFLIYNTLSFSVLQRRELMGQLRVLGATPADLFRLVLGEGLLIGGLGTLLGLMLGILLAQELVQLVTQTINDLYFVLTVREFSLTPMGIIKGVLLGVGGSLLAVVVPASEAALSPPRRVQNRSGVERGTQRLLHPFAWSGMTLLIAAAVLLLLSDSLLFGFIALFVLILGFSLLTPLWVSWMCRCSASLFGGLFGSLGRMAVRGVQASLSRTGVAIAALSIAVATTVGVGVMVGSFRVSVQQWLESSLQADIFISPDAPSGTGHEAALAPEVLQTIEHLPGVAGIRQSRPVEIQSGDEITHLTALRMAKQSYAGVNFLQGKAEAVWPQFEQEQAVIISEPYAYHRGLHAGDTLELETNQGKQPFKIAGVFRDYETEQGVIKMRMPLYQHYWGDESIYSTWLYLQPGVDVDTVLAELQRLVGEQQALRIYASKTLREASIKTFDRTFAITHVLRLLVIGVAFVGILSALMALQLEKSRELAVLRATGFTPRQVWGLVTAQTGFMGLVSGLLALPLGLVLAAVLIFVVNRRAFGWSMDVVVPGMVLLDAVLLALVAALLAGLYPAWRMSQTAPAQALREE